MARAAASPPPSHPAPTAPSPRSHFGSSRRHRSGVLEADFAWSSPSFSVVAGRQAKGEGKVKDSWFHQQRNEVTATVVGMPELNRTLLLFRWIPDGRVQTFSLPTTRHRSTDWSGPLPFSASSRSDRNTQESSGTIHSAGRGEVGRLPTIRRKGEEEARCRRGRCDEGTTDKVKVGVRAHRRCAEVAALAGGSSRTTQGPDSRAWRGASNCTRGASGRGQPIARHHRGSAAREGSVAIRGVPRTHRRKSSVGTVSDRPGRHVEQGTGSILWRDTRCTRCCRKPGLSQCKQSRTSHPS